MAINIENENVMSLTEAARILPRRGGRRIAISTLWRWCRLGLRGVRLEYVRIGRNIGVSHEALNRFFNALAEMDEPPAGGEATRPVRKREPTAAVRQRQMEEADRILDEARI